MKKILSYIWPLSKKRHTNFNGVLELTQINGKLVLDSKNANYSFGSLQRILETGLSKIELTKVSSVLLLGLGGGSVIKSLRDKFGYTNKIDAVEIDPIVIDIARNNFNVHESEYLHISNTDAFEYVKCCSSVFDLVIVDLFIDDKVPSQFYSMDFCLELSRIISDTGCAVFNMGINDISADERNQVIDFFSINPKFECTLLEKIEETNTILIIKSASHNAV